MIDMALESAEEGGEVNMRDVLDEMLEALCEDRCQKMSQEIREKVSREVRQEELEKGLQATIRTCKRFHASQAETIENIQKEFSLTQEEAAGYVEKYW